MITEKDLIEAIAECQGVKNPNANTCIKLAAYYTIKQNLYPDKVVDEVQYTPTYSYVSGAIDYDSDTDFARAVYGKTVEEVMPVIDELMSTVQVLNKPLYNAVLRKLG